MPDLKGAAAGPLLIRRDTSLSSKEREGLTPRGGGAAGDRDRDVLRTPRSARPPQHQNSRQGPRGEKFVRGGTAMSRAPDAPVIQEQTDVQSVDGGPKTEKGKLFKKLQVGVQRPVTTKGNCVEEIASESDALLQEKRHPPPPCLRLTSHESPTKSLLLCTVPCQCEASHRRTCINFYESFNSVMCNRGKSTTLRNACRLRKGTGSNFLASKPIFSLTERPSVVYGQEEIREGVERADNALLQYEVKTDALDKLELAAESARPPSPHATPLPDNLDDIIPAAEQMAKERINESHEEAMRRLVDMYKSLNDEQTGIFASQSTLPDEENVLLLLEEVASHRKEVWPPSFSLSLSLLWSNVHRRCRLLARWR